ncbi:MAG: glycosyltransferase family 9 protein [Chitinophagaceae bacterium]|nr:glycosyltransferase family 9 protein [Chitinophagaceae bacterium]
MNLKAKQFIDTWIGIPLVYSNMILAKLLGFILRRNHQLKDTPTEICIIKLLGFGSVIMASDALYSIRLKYPNAKLSIICSRSIHAGIESIQLFDHIYVIDDGSFFRVLTSGIKTVFQLWRVKCLWILDLEVYSKLTSILSLWTMAQNRFGFYFNDVAFRYNLNTHNIYFNTTIQVEENYNRMVNALGVESFQAFTIPGFPPRKNQAGLDQIAINNTCSELAMERKLRDGQLIDLCKAILNETNYQIVLLGAPSDQKNLDEFIAYSGLPSERMFHIAGRYELRDYYEYLYRHCALMITIDSAPLHIANKLNIPNLSIWGPTAPESRIDTQSGNEYLYLKVSCSPCAHFVDKLPCGGNNFCIQDMTTQMIMQKVKTMLTKQTTN